MRNVRQWKDAEGRKCLGLEVAVEWDDEKKTNVYKCRELINERLWDSTRLNMVQYDGEVKVFDIIMDKVHLVTDFISFDEDYEYCFCTEMGAMTKSLFPFQAGMKNILVVDLVKVGEDHRNLRRLERLTMFGNDLGRENEECGELSKRNYLFYIERMELCERIQNALRKSVVRLI